MVGLYFVLWGKSNENRKTNIQEMEEEDLTRNLLAEENEC